MSVDAEKLAKSPTGIGGLDELTRGGLPQGRATLVAGNAGCGKSLFALSFLINGATQYDEPGVFVSFEETPEDLATNVRSLGFDVEGLAKAGKLSIEHIDIDPSEIHESGEFDLTALFIRIGAAITEIGAKRVVLDTIESLFMGFDSQRTLRSELVRLFRWLKAQGVTTVITGERSGGQSLTRQGIEEYVSDCVIVLDHRLEAGISTRSLRVAKYRGTAHGTSEYPFIIDTGGFVVLPITSIGLEHDAPDERISTGVEGLDAMMAGGGVYRGASVLVSGTAGSGKTTFASSMLKAACERGEQCALFSFEESPQQLIRNMRSVGIDLGTHVESGLLRIRSVRPTRYGLESHLARIHREIEEMSPRVVAIDPITALISAGSEAHARAVLLRLVDMLKASGITAVLTSLGKESAFASLTENQVSSLMDTWVSLRINESNGERNRELYLLKSRGMGHSNQIREFILNKRGMHLVHPYVGVEGVLTGSARIVQEIKEKTEAELSRLQVERTRRQLESRENALDARIEQLRAEFEQERNELLITLAEAEAREKTLEADLTFVARRRTSASFDDVDQVDEHIDEVEG